MCGFCYPEDAPIEPSHSEGDGCEYEFGPGVHNLGATPLNRRDAAKLAEFIAALKSHPRSSKVHP